MAAPLFDRRLRVTFYVQQPVFAENRYTEYEWVLDTEDTPMRIDFRVKEFTAYPYPQGELKIYNLAPETRALLQNAGRISISAGYVTQQQLPILFVGSVNWSETKYRGQDVVSEFILGGRVEFEMIVKDSYVPPQPLNDVAESLIEKAVIEYNRLTGGAVKSDLHLTNIDVAVVDTGGTEVGPTGNLQTPPNWSDSGKFVEVFSKLMDSFNLIWYCDEESGIHILGDRIPRNALEFTINEDVGMIGTPTVNKRGVTARLLLDSRIKLRTGLRINSEKVILDDYYTPSEVEHKGSTWTNTWETTVQAVTADA